MAEEKIGDQLQRRREASYRLPPLTDGRRDPLDPKPRQTCTECETYLDPDGSCWTCSRVPRSVA